MKRLLKYLIYNYIFSYIGIFKVFVKVCIFGTVSEKNKIISGYAKKLKGCFDLENKGQRSVNETLNLIEYCMKEFGIDKLFFKFLFK